jgi:hypothetical protein
MRLFAAPPSDDHALLEAAQALLSDGPEETRGVDIDLATALFYQRVRLQPANRQLIDALESTESKDLPFSAPHLIVIPGFLHESRPELGADGELIMTIARRCGLTIERAPTSGSAPLSENAARLREYFRKREGAPAWIISLSRGTSDVAWGLRGPDPIPMPGVIGWVNLCGSPHGSPLALEYRTGWRWCLGQALRLYLNVPQLTLREYASDHEHWRQPLHLPTGLRVINVVACPLRWHLARHTQSDHALLAHRGPNDGVTLCHEAAIAGGETYPLWGADHYFRAPQVVPMLYRLLRYLGSDTPKPIPPAVPTEELP